MARKFIQPPTHSDLSFVLNEFGATHIELPSENANYSACTFRVGDTKIALREANITPKKIGQFVALWKRSVDGKTLPFDAADPFDFVIITVRLEENFGLFILPKKVLVERAIFSEAGILGKRGFRVYPPWDLPQNQQAKRTQNWQVQYFFELAPRNERERTVLFIKTGRLVSLFHKTDSP